ncbi:MAG TPA: amino acid adenylation domain-containing protein [Herpetosiphonaceae bacterium]
MQVKNVEDFYPLSPLQQGMLFHSLYTPDSGEYFEQFTCTLAGHLDGAQFERAWQHVVDRHPSLRAAFIWEGPREPVQVVQRQAKLPFYHEDWQSLSVDEQETRLAALLSEDRQRGFDLARAPLMRLRLIKQSNQSHILIWSHHHLLIDGWCISLIIREVLAFYDAFLAGRTLRLPHSRPYRDYIIWLQQQDRTAAEHFWRQQLHGISEPTPLGVGQPRPEQPGVQQSYGEQVLSLSTETTAALRTFGQHHQLTINTLVQGAWALLLSRYSGTSDIVFGATVSGRPVSLSGVESIIGQFINTLPVRVRVPPAAALVPWLQALQAQHVELRQYEYSPLVDVQGWSEIPRGQPLFESLLVVENYPFDLSLLERPHGPHVQDIHAVERQNYPLAIFASPGQELGFRILYNADRFDAETITRMLGHLQTILAGMAATSLAGPRLDRITLLSPSEQQQMLTDWNPPAIAAPPDESIQQRFEAQAARTPDAIAVVSPTILPGAFDRASSDQADPFQAERLTYGTLNERANQLARHLRALGIGLETPVGFYLDRSADLIVAILGILKAGAAYVPLNPNYPMERLQFMLEDTRAPVLLTTAGLTGQLPPHQAHVVYLDTDWQQISCQATTNLLPANTAHHLAYVIYTSGSTGRPKGVQVSHGSVLSLMDATRPVFQFTDEDVWTVVHSFGFDFSVWEMWAPLLHGSRLVVVPEWIAQAPEVFYDLLCHERVTIINQTPSALRHLLPIKAVAETMGSQHALRLIMCGGEAFPRELAAEALQWNVPIWNFYGPTEATVWAAIQPVAHLEATAFVPVGRPLANSQIYLLDKYGQPVPVGVAGELHIGGANLARGYLNRPMLTAEKFVPHPFSGQAGVPAGARLYRSGDVARYLADGRIEFLGRIDAQIKLRGFRIELGEIEAVLSQHPAVKTSVVLMREDTPPAGGHPDQRLVAYLVTHPDAPGLDAERVSRESEHIAHWQLTWDETYAQGSASDPTFNLTGWTSNYTRQPIPAEEMRDWRDHTVARILGLQPERVLEIGCGTGLLLFAIAPQCSQYIGTDMSRTVLDTLQQHIGARNLPQVTLRQQAADDPTGLPAHSFDVVILNSVIQYFPNVEYLIRTIEHALRCVKPGGALFIGDVRNLELLEAFHTAVELAHAPDTLTTEQFRQRVQRRIAQEKELVIHPQLFSALQHRFPQISAVEIQLKRGSADNEVTQFRYDVVLRVNQPGAPAGPVTTLDWMHGELTPADVRQVLCETSPERLEIANIPNRRLIPALTLGELLTRQDTAPNVGELRAALRDALAAEVDTAVTPEAWWEVCADLPYNAMVTWSQTTGSGQYDVYYQRTDTGRRPSLPPTSRVIKPWQEYANRPLTGQWLEALEPQLRQFLQTRLPAYMVPAAFVLLEALPLTTNGKIDRAALPAPTSARPELRDSFIAPRTPIEEVLTAIWADVLKFERIGIHDNFFELGGHSLLAIQVIARVGEAFQLRLPLQRLFDAPTIAQLATVIAEQKGNQSSYSAAMMPLPQIVPALEQRDQPFPMTEIQQAYWVGRSGVFELGNVAAHIYLEIESDRLDLERLTRAVRRLVDRHGMLRAIVLPDGQQQILSDVPPYQIIQHDLRDYTAEEAERELAVIRERGSHQILATDRWPLFEIKATLLSQRRIRLHVSIDLLIIDAWSAQIILRELSQLYEDPAVALPALELSFRDYIMAEQMLAETALYQRADEYWTRRLPTLSPPPELPLANNPAAITAQRFIRRQHRLEPDTWQRLKRRATSSGLTPTGALLAAFTEVLAVWSKSPRFTINLTLFNRLPLHPQVNDIVGDFTSVTLLAVDPGDARSFVARAQRLQEQLWEDLDHRYVSGVRVLRDLARLRGTAPHAAMPIVFTSALSLATSAYAGSTVFDTLIEPVYAISQTPQVWLDHQVSEHGGALVFKWDAVEELFPAGLLNDMFSAYCQLLGRLADEPSLWNAPIRQLLPETQLLQRSVINATDAPISDDLLHTLFLNQVTRRADQPAVITPTHTLSYTELQCRAQAIGRSLQEQGVQPNQLVAVVLDKGWEQIVAVLGVLLSGAAYLPIDPDLPPERLWYLLEHAEAQIVLTSERLDAARAWPEQVQRLAIDRIEPEVQVLAWPVVQRPEDLAYVIYTSGSTGLPKGVMIDHRGAVNTLLDINQRFAVGVQDRILACSSLSFDLSVYDIFGTLAAGGTIVMPSAAETRNPAHWLELIDRAGVTIWNSVPALMQMLIEYLLAQGLRLPDTLRLVLLSGDWIPVALPEQIVALGQTPEIISLGGATEASIWSILYPIGTVQPDWRSIPYGRPMRNQRFHILNAALEPCPVWVPGQLYIGGIGLAQGYWRDPEKTGERFIIHPQTGERLYVTGDLGRYLPSGEIEFLGREDFQVKVQGYRVELGEIEATLLQHPDVAAAVVVTTTAGSAEQHAGPGTGTKRLIAYVVPRSAEPEQEAHAAQYQELAAETLHSFLQTKLPAYMRPARFVLLDRLPLTPNGKIDRQSLPAPELARSTEGNGHVPPRSQTERTLTQIWSEVLRAEQVGVTDNFFELGGDSILGIQVTARANQAGLPLNARQIFQTQTIAELAATLDTTSNTRATLADQGIVTGPVLLTPIQHWFFENIPIDPQHWNQALLLEVPSQLDFERLDRAVRQVQIQHDALRLRFTPGTAGWQQHSAGLEAIEPLSRIDLTALTVDEQRARLETAAAELQASLDLASGPLLRVVHLGLGTDQPGRLLLIIHHLAIDAVSWRILLEDLQSIYDQLGNGDVVQVPPKTTSFQHWAEQLTAFAQSAAVTNDREYWLEATRKQVAPLPIDTPHGAEHNLMGTAMSITTALSTAETAALLHTVPQVYQTQINDLLLTALGQTITRWSGGTLLLVDLEAHGREPFFEEIDLSRTVGWLASLFPVCLELGQSTLGAEIKSVKEQLRRIPQHGLSYGLLRYLHPNPQIGAELRGLPQAQIRFNYLGQLDAALTGTSLFAPAGESSGPAQSPRGRRPYLLSITSSVAEGQLHLTWTYSLHLHHTTTIEWLAAQYIADLQALIQHCLSPDAGGFTPSDFPEAGLTQADLDELLEQI